MRRALLLSLLSLSCGGRELPQPKVLSFSPTQILEGTATLITVDVEGVPPMTLDYGSEAVAIEHSIVVKLGAFEGTADRTAASPNQLTVGLPETLSPGPYPLEIEFPDGRTATGALPFTVAPSPLPLHYDITAPDGGAIGNQQRRVPFEILIRGEGGLSNTFDGAVSLSASHGTISPTVTGNFFEGTRLETVTLSNPTADMTITVEDVAGHSGTSNRFKVLP